MRDLRCGALTATAAVVSPVARIAPASVRRPSGTSPDARNRFTKSLPTLRRWQTYETESPGASVPMRWLHVGATGSSTVTSASSTSPVFATTTSNVAVPRTSCGIALCVLASTLPTICDSSFCTVGVVVIVIAGRDAVASELPPIAAATISDPTARARPSIVRTYHCAAPKSSHPARRADRGSSARARLRQPRLPARRARSHPQALRRSALDRLPPRVLRLAPLAAHAAGAFHGALLPR